MFSLRMFIVRMFTEVTGERIEVFRRGRSTEPLAGCQCVLGLLFP